MSNLKAKNVFSYDENGDQFPLYCKYQNQYDPQKSYITLNIENGEIDAYYSSVVGSCEMPESVFHDRILRFPIDSNIRAEKINELIEDNINTFQLILNGSTVKWDGNNFTGRFNEKIGGIIEILSDELEQQSHDYNIDIIHTSEDLLNYLDSEIYPKQDQSFTDFAQAIISNIDLKEYALSDAINSPEKLLDVLEDTWAELLYCGRVLPQNVAQYLLNEGTCNNSQYMPELKAMANGTYDENDF